MALITCSKCGAQISDKAEACIKCGYPIEKSVVESVEEISSVPIDETVSIDSEIAESPASQSIEHFIEPSLRKKKPTKFKKVVFIIISVIIVAITLVVFIPTLFQSSKKPISVAITFDADLIKSPYSVNETEDTLPIYEFSNIFYIVEPGTYIPQIVECFNDGTISAGDNKKYEWSIPGYDVPSGVSINSENGELTVESTCESMAIRVKATHKRDDQISFEKSVTFTRFPLYNSGTAIGTEVMLGGQKAYVIDDNTVAIPFMSNGNWNDCKIYAGEKSICGITGRLLTKDEAASIPQSTLEKILPMWKNWCFYVSFNPEYRYGNGQPLYIKIKDSAPGFWIDQNNVLKKKSNLIDISDKNYCNDYTYGLFVAFDLNERKQLGYSVLQEESPQNDNPLSIEKAVIPKQTTVGDVISFGNYKWQVLAKNKKQILLLSEELVEKQVYSSSAASVNWERCTLRSYLNGEFYNTFSDGEKAVIVDTKVSNKKSKKWGTKAGNDTTDKIFLLSIDEFNKYSVNIDPKYNGETYWWWLRSPGLDDTHPAGVHFKTGLDESGGLYSHANGVRPAMWVSIE